MNPLPPWANGPFELLVHAEGHRLGGEDFDRRIALISFDNAIEVTITTYLTLHPIQRGDRQYRKDDVEKWLRDYHSKLDFLATELTSRSVAWQVGRPYIVWAHEQRNEQYHGGNKGTPEKNCLSVIREAALWVFGLLFDDAEPAKRLELAVAEKLPPAAPQPDADYDRAIDQEYGMIQIGDESFYASELLFSVDYDAYRDAGARLCQKPQRPDEVVDGENRAWAN